MATQEKQKTEAKTNTPLPDKGTDILKEYLPHLLSALAGLGGSYFLFGKPTQDQVKEVAERLIDLEKKINFLWEERQENKKRERLNGLEEEDDDFLIAKRQSSLEKKSPKKISRIN